MRTFRVFVTGIAGFVEDFRRVVAVNASRPRSIRIIDAGIQREVTIPAHFPYVRVPLDHVDPVNMPDPMPILQDWNISAAPGAFPPLGDLLMVRETLVRFLRSEEVVLPESPTAPDVDKTPLNGIVPDDTDKKSVLWLPTLSSLGATTTTIDPKHVTEDPDPNFVAAYIRFPKGIIETAHVSEYKFGAVSLDGHSACTLNRAVALLMVCRMEVPDGPFIVRCRSYQGEPEFKIAFKADIPDPWMVFACSSLEDAFQLPAIEEKYGTDFHFLLCYDLVQGPIKDGDIALPKSSALPVGARPLGAGKCVPPGFDGGSTGGV